MGDILFLFQLGNRLQKQYMEIKLRMDDTTSKMAQIEIRLDQIEIKRKEAEVEALRRQLNDLQTQFAAFRQQSQLARPSALDLKRDDSLSDSPNSKVVAPEKPGPAGHVVAPISADRNRTPSPVVHSPARSRSASDDDDEGPPMARLLSKLGYPVWRIVAFALCEYSNLILVFPMLGVAP